ncbi:MAG: beta-galactosidase trimerization domain-containing protein [Clostridia bacterium]|nr:beta-galactosidase trimerization domain-containing protein [Clostridia bacterium]
MEDFRLRQIHLDFHTSPLIPDVGGRFDKKEWQETLKLGHVDSITVFSKCHHGYSYHPTKVNTMNPTLKFDLLKAQLEACEEIGVRAPVYISAGLDEKDAVAHHEWLMRGKDNWMNEPDFSKPGYHGLCFNTPYLDKLIAEIEEVMQNYNPCEIFLDIVGERTCWCDKCRADMTAAGLDFNNDDDVRSFGKKIYRNYLDRVEKAVHKYNPDTIIFQNSGHVTKGRRDLIDTIECLELESLPTGGWGYDHFPMSAAYARTQRESFLGMTGKFHKSWGEFGGFKHPNALRYEAALSLSQGGGCSIGDQMHPEGLLNKSTFGLIGKAYAEVEAKEPWCKGAKNIADIAVLSAEAHNPCGDSTLADTGANRALLEANRLYNFVDLEEDFTKYKMLILPDVWNIDAQLKTKLDEFLAQGGKLLLSGKSGLDENNQFVFDTGIKFIGENKFCPTYFIPGFETVNGTTEYLMRAANYRFENVDAEIAAKGQNPYFNRTAEHFCSHQHAPNDRSLEYPTVAFKGNIAYIGWDIFKGYAEFGDFHIKEIISYAVERLMGDSFTIKSAVPDRGVTTLTQQGDRKIVHLLYAHTTKRGRDTEVIEDIVPLYNVDVSVKCDKPSKVILVPQNEEIEFSYKDGEVSFTVPKVEIHQMISIE